MGSFGKFRDYPYVRPDFEKERQDIKQYIQDIRSADSYETLRRVYLEREKASQQFDTMFQVAYVRNTIDTTDAFYEAEMTNFYKEMGPLRLLDQEAGAALLASPYLEDFKKEFGSLIVKNIEVGQKLASPAVVDDFTKESGLCMEFSRTVAGCHTDFHKEDCNFYGLLKHMEDSDRSVRKEAFTAWSNLYESVSGELDRIYDELVELRSGMAKKLGFNSYVSMIYAQSGHYDYTPDDVAVLRKQILEYVTPLCSRLYEKQAKELGISKLEWYDEALSSPNGNAVPIGTKDELVAKAQQMYHELSKETGEFFDFMVEHEMFDLESKPGKQTGGYCTFFSSMKSPFIFANFNGTSADVDVLTHEAGHAFESYTSCRVNPLSSQTFGTSELCEIHSMSMELFTYPWMESFFGDKADQYRYDHLASALKVLPYMACVDEFQHRVFAERPDAAGRRAIWRSLEKTYMPWRSYDDSSFLEGGGFWMQKMHIFLNPFYYIDYAMAQMSAFEFYKKMEEDRPKAWADYYRLCQSGGSRSYFASLEYAGLANPLKEGTVKSITEFLETRLF